MYRSALTCLVLLSTSVSTCVPIVQNEDSDGSGLLPLLARCERFSDCASGFCGAGGVCGLNECGSDEECGAEVCARSDVGSSCEPAGERGELCHRRTDTPPRGALDKSCADGLVCEIFGAGFETLASCVPLEGAPRGLPRWRSVR